MLLYMQDFVNSLVALGSQHFSSPSVPGLTEGVENRHEHSCDVRLLCWLKSIIADRA